LRDFWRYVCAQALWIETVVNAEQLLSRNPQLQVLSSGVLGMTDAAQKASMAKDMANPRTQRWNLVGPRPVVIEHDALSEEQSEPGDQQIARIPQVRLPKLTPEWQAQATAQMSQHRWPEGCPSADRRHARQRGCGFAIGLVRGGNMQPRPRSKGGQMSRGG